MTYHVPTDGPISSPYGSRQSQRAQTARDGSIELVRERRHHQGTDFSGAVGAPVYAIADGVVEVVTPNGAAGFNCYGIVVTIHHTELGELRSLSAHLSRALVRVGERVRAGDVIGEVGNSNGAVWARGSTFADGDCNASRRQTTPRRGPPRPHLHFEVSEGRYPKRYAAPRLNPIEWLREHGLPYTSDEAGGRPVRRSTAGPGAGDDDGGTPSESRERDPPSAGPLLALGFGLALLARR